MASPDTARWRSYTLFHIYWSRLFVQVFVSWLIESHVFAAEPSFRVPEKNVTYIQGDTAVLECTIHNLKEHQVVWADPTGFLLTLNQKRVIEDVRVSVERPTVKDWNLHIQNVNFTDEGRYVCEINTEPVKKREVMLIVKVPPRIIDKLSTESMITAREGETVELTCNATGVPQPEIRWFRMSPLKREREKIGTAGERLKIHNVSRDCGGTYICEAGNGYGPNKTRRMQVDVQYPPEVFLGEHKMGQYIGKNTILQCEVTAHPLGELYWARNGKDVTKQYHMRSKYKVEMFNTDDDHKKVLSLTIKNISIEDYGLYLCIAKNYFGSDKETMILYDYSIRKATTTTTTMRPLVIGTPSLPKNTGTYVVQVNMDRNRQRGRTRPQSGNTEAVKGSNMSTTIRPVITSYLIAAQLCLCMRYVLSIL